MSDEKRYLSAPAIRFALSNVLARDGDTDVLPVPDEYAVLREYWPRIENWLSSLDMSRWPPRAPRRCLAPKGDGGFRVVTQLDPIEQIVYTALVYEVGGKLEAIRRPQSAQEVFSWRFQPEESDGRLFDPESNWDGFISRSSTAGSTGWILDADISDFYPRIYTHRLENVLDEHGGGWRAEAIKNLIRVWNHNQSYGLPVGQDASRLLSDTVIHDVDNALAAEGADFARFADDYRFFCQSIRECNFWLMRLAELLFRLHGLTLQASKTRIRSAHEFAEDMSKVLESSERAEMEAKVRSIVPDLDWIYGFIPVQALPPQQRAELLQLDIPSSLHEQLASARPDTKYLRSLLQWLILTEDERAIGYIIAPGNTEKLRPAIDLVARYLDAVPLPATISGGIARWLWDALTQSSLGDSEYSRAWLLWVTGPKGWLSDQQLIELWNTHPDEFTRPAVARALGFNGAQYWFRERKSDIAGLSPWLRRAVLMGAVCLPEDEKKHWFSALRRTADDLEDRIIARNLHEPIDPFTGPGGVEPDLEPDDLPF
jgi:reverse transcriptase-like protein